MFRGESGAGKKHAVKLADDAFDKIIRIAGAFRLTGSASHEYSTELQLEGL